MSEAVSASHPHDEALEQWVTGTLDEAGRREVGAHLPRCLGCRRFVAALERALVPLPAKATPAPDAADTHVSGPTLLPGQGLPAGHTVLAAPVGRYAAPGGLLELGRGGLGRVLQVKDTALGRDVALKEIHEVPERAKAAVEARFVREARLAGQLEHPGICPVHDFARDEQGRLFYVMRRIEGQTLAQAVAARKTLAERLALVPNVLALAQAVAYAHSRGVIHRDIKPQNVMVGPFGETLLLDWGLAREKSEGDLPLKGVDSQDAQLSRQGDALGTPAYMAPEQAEGRVDAIDERTDLWALGGVLYEVVTGHPPYKDSTVESVLRKARAGVVTPLEEVEPEVPRELAAIAARCLAPPRSQRYPTVKALVADLEAFLAGRRVSAYDYSAMELLKRRVRRHRVGLAAIAAGLAVVLVAGTMYLWRLRTERDEFRRLSTLLVDKASNTLRNVPGARLTLLELLTEIRRTMERLGTNGPREDQERLVKAMTVGGQMELELGHLTDAAATFTSTVAVTDAMLERGADVRTLELAGHARATRAFVLEHLGKGVEAERLMDDASELLRRARELDPKDVDTLDTLELVASYRTQLAETRGRALEALGWAEKGIVLHEQLMTLKGPSKPRDRFNYIVGFVQVSEMARAAGATDSMRRASERALAAARDFLDKEPGLIDSAEALFEAERAAGVIASDQGDEAVAQAHFAVAAKQIDWLSNSELENVDYLGRALLNDLRRRDDAAARQRLSRLLTHADVEAAAVPMMLGLLVLESPRHAVEEYAAREGLRGQGTEVFALVAAALAQDRAASVRLARSPGIRRFAPADWARARLVERVADLAPALGEVAAPLTALVADFEANQVSSDADQRTASCDRYVAAVEAGLK